MYKLKYHLKENVTCKRSETRIKTSLMNSIKMQAYITQKAKGQGGGHQKKNSRLQKKQKGHREEHLSKEQIKAVAKSNEITN